MKIPPSLPCSGSKIYHPNLSSIAGMLHLLSTTTANALCAIELEPYLVASYAITPTTMASDLIGYDISKSHTPLAQSVILL